MFRVVLAAFVVNVFASDAVIVLHPSSFLTTSGLQPLDDACSSDVGPTFQALVCANGREWSGLNGAELYTSSGSVGIFPTLTNPILEPSGAQPVPGDEIMTGCSPSGDPSANCGDFTLDSGMLDIGRSADINGWFWFGQGSCGIPSRIYCISFNPPPAVWVSASKFPSTSSLDAMNQACRSEDYGIFRTFALVCQPTVIWPDELQNSLVFHKARNATIGPDAFTPPTFPLDSAILDAAGNPVSGSIFTGCDLDFMYRGPSGACSDWTTSMGVSGLITDGGVVQRWGGSGVSVPCASPLPFFCVRMTRVLPTPVPTPEPTTVVPTTQAPTTAMPTTTSPTTTSPTTTSPTTQVPTTAPTTEPTPAPSPGSNAPTAPTGAPTRAPTTPRPTAIVVITNFTGNVTQNVTVPGYGADVTVILPSSLFLYGNSTASVVIGKGSLGNIVAEEFLGGDSVVSVDVLVDGQPVDVMGLGIPVEFVIPRPVAVCAAQLATPSKCVWWDTNDLTWRTDNCTTAAVTMEDGNPGTKCSCNHLTDFAVLLDRAARCTQAYDESYVVFAVIYGLIALYCLVVVARLQMLHDPSTRFLQAQHSAIGATAVVRMLSCLRFYGLLGDDLVFEGFLTALPYLIEFWIFTRLASTWLGLVEFTMLSSELRWEKLRPWLYGINIVGSLFVIGLFAAFFVELDFTTALVGTIGIASVYMILALAFLYYSSRLITTMSPGDSLKRSGSPTLIKIGLCSPSTKILLAGRVSAVCFCIQAVSSVLALVLERELITHFTITFLAFNCLALIGLLMVYQGAVAKALRVKVAATEASQSVELMKGSPSFSRPS